MSNEITKQILEEMLDLSVKVIRYAERQKVNRSIQDQLIRAITSIGANYSEAQDASSKKDFLNKIYIAKKEASESIYWLKLCARLNASKENVELEDRTRKFVLLLQKIINSSKEKS